MTEVFRIGLIVLLAMLALLAGVGGGAPGAIMAVQQTQVGHRLGFVHSSPAAVWVCHPGNRCLHMLVRQP
jgi:hypothetical protein